MCYEVTVKNKIIVQLKVEWKVVKGKWNTQIALKSWEWLKITLRIAVKTPEKTYWRD